MISDKEWEEFRQWCQEKYPSWSPNRATLRLYFEWLEDKKKKEGYHG